MFGNEVITDLLRETFLELLLWKWAAVASELGGRRDTGRRETALAVWQEETGVRAEAGLRRAHEQGTAQCVSA